MPHLTIIDSPCPEVRLVPYNANEFPKFQQLFEKAADPNSPLRHLAPDPVEADVALVLENLSDRAITALRYRWLNADESGKVRPRTCTSDSYMVDVFRPVVAPHSRQLITPSSMVNESIIDHVQKGGGFIGAGVGMSAQRFISDTNFELDLVLFDDGEICGPDRDRFAGELQCRKPAAEFVAKEVRLAEAEGRYPAPVLNALASVPHLGDDPLAHWTQHYAKQYLRRPGEATLRHLENRPVLPKFYRKQT